MFDSKYMRFWKRQNFGGRRRDQYVQGLKGKEEGTYWAEELLRVKEMV